MDKPQAFQSYDDTSDAAQCAPRLAALRAELARRGLDGFVIPHSDEHMGEYLPARAERLAWLTAFTGSAGAAVVLMDRAVVFTDGRYTLQVRAQTDTSLFEPRDLVAEGPQGWIPEHLAKGARLGYDPWLHTANAVAGLRAATERAGGTLVACDTNPIDAVWPDQPPPPATRAIPHALNLAGEQSDAKRLALADGLKKSGAAAAVVTLADSVCWLLNIRGADVPHTPFTLVFAILNDDGSADLFLDEQKRSPELTQHLGNSVRLRAPGEFPAALDALAGKTVIADPATAAAAILDRLHRAGARIRHAPDPCQLPKACKNPLEIEGMRKAHIRDGGGAGAVPRLVRARGGGRRTDRDCGGTGAGRFPPRHRLPVGPVIRFHRGGGAERRHRALPRHALHQPRHRARRDVPDRLRGAISRRHHRCDAHPDRGAPRRRR